MPLPSAVIVEMAKSYAYHIERGYTPEESEVYISHSFGPASRRQVRSAIELAQRATRIGENMSHLGPNDPLRSAFEGTRVPSQDVGVRVMITSVDSDGVTRVFTVYLDMRWSQTRSDVDTAVADWIRQRPGRYAREVSHSYVFAGPTYWPANYP